MLNIEKYINELVELDTNAIGLIHGKITPCSQTDCKCCEFKCSYANLYKWLASEYKESLLSEKGKYFIKEILLYDFEVDDMTKIKLAPNFTVMNSKGNIRTITINNVELLRKLVNNPKINYFYTLKDLGLC